MTSNSNSNSNSNALPVNAYDTVKKHLELIGDISIRDAMSEHGLSGGHLTKIISSMRRNGLPIVAKWQRNILTRRRYKRYYIAPNILSVEYIAAE